MLQRRLGQLSGTQFRTLTGLTRTEFAALLPTFAAALTTDQAASWQGRTRRRRPGGGRRGVLPTPADKLGFILVYIRLYPVQALQGALFGLSQPRANEWIQDLLPVLETALGTAVALPARPAATVEALIAQMPTLHFLVDVTERPLRRPGTPAARDAYWSGKQHRHTHKTTLVTDPQGHRIVYLGTPQPGRTHDKTALVAEEPPWPPGSHLTGDLGYLGHTAPHLTVMVPAKKPRGHDFSPAQREDNTHLARYRVPVEHAIRGYKLSRCVAEVQRTRTQTDRYGAVAAGLHNWRRHHRAAQERTVA